MCTWQTSGWNWSVLITELLSQQCVCLFLSRRLYLVVWGQVQPREPPPPPPRHTCTYGAGCSETDSAIDATGHKAIWGQLEGNECAEPKPLPGRLFCGQRERGRFVCLLCPLQGWLQARGQCQVADMCRTGVKDGLGFSPAMFTQR